MAAADGGRPAPSAAALAEVHGRAHEVFAALAQHLGALDAAALDRELPGFGHPTVRLQLHHVIGAEVYWIGVLQGRIEVDFDHLETSGLPALEAWRQATAAATAAWLARTPDADLAAARPCAVWGGRTLELTPGHVVMRVVTHLFQHKGQLAAMSRLLGHPVPDGLDYRHD